MFCQNCGNELPEGAAACPRCGQMPAAPVQASAQSINSHLVFAILTTLCCCLPFGVVSIVYAAQVSTMVNCGNIAAAQQASDKAFKWAVAALVCGLITNAIAVFLQVAISMGMLALGCK